MDGYMLKRPKEESVVLEGTAVQKLLAAGNGDAALLYLAILETHGGAVGALEQRLHWQGDRLRGAMRALDAMGLVTWGREAEPSKQPPKEPPRREERPEYTRADLARAMEGPEFAQLSMAVEEKLGKKLTTPDLAILLGLYNDIGFPADVIFLLVGFCVERSARQYGPGRKPTLRQIEREGYAWERRELMDMERADAYIQKYQAAQEDLPKMMALLRLGDRKPSPSEEKYLRSWHSMGFAPEVIEAAYDRTVIKCKELRWSYMNRILVSWNSKGYKTLDDVAEEDRSRAKAPDRQEEAARDDFARMDKYLEQLRQEQSREEK